MASSKLNANGIEIGIIEDSTLGTFLCLTDIARYRNPDDPIGAVSNWLRNRSTIDFLGLWEELHNTDFKLLEFEEFQTVDKVRGNAADFSYVKAPQIQCLSGIKALFIV